MSRDPMSDGWRPPGPTREELELRDATVALADTLARLVPCQQTRSAVEDDILVEGPCETELEVRYVGVWRQVICPECHAVTATFTDPR